MCSRSGWGPMHVLIIEDQFLTSTLIEDTLRDLSYTSFDMVDTEEAAIRSATQQCPDLIIVDQRLTRGTGVNAIRVICAERPIPVVFLTDYGDEVLKLVPDAVLLRKPFADRSLREAVGQAIVSCRHKVEAAEK